MADILHQPTDPQNPEELYRLYRTLSEQLREQLAQIDPSTYQVNVLRTEAELANSKANLALAEVQARRAEELFKSKLIPQSEYDQSIATLHQAEAQVKIRTASLERAKARIGEAGLRNVKFQEADIYRLPFSEAHFDHVFVCFVLEHLARPEAALAELRRVLKPGGTLTVIEGDHGSAYFHPDSEFARRAVQGLVELQRRAGGDALIGRRLYPLLVQAGVREVRVSPRMVYVDASRPTLVDGFIRKTFTAMVEGVSEQAIRQGLIDAESWRQGIRDLYRTAEADGTFCYTFFKAIGVK